MSILKIGMYASEKIDSANWLEGWSCRQKITVPASSVRENFNDFPVFVDLSFLNSVSGSDWWGNVNTFGQDIRVTLKDGITQVPMELMTVIGFATYGFIYFKADVSSFEDTDFWIYCGNYDAEVVPFDDPLGRNAVWSDYLWVVHDGGSYDSTGNLSDPIVTGVEVGNYQTQFGYITSLNVTGGGVYFDDPLGIAKPLVFELSCAFIRAANAQYFIHRFGSNVRGVGARTFTNNESGLGSGGVASVLGSGFLTNTLYMGTFLERPAALGNVRALRNGVNVTTSPIRPSVPDYGDSQGWTVGAYGGGSFAGAVGLIRLSEVIRPPAHHKLEYDLHFNNYNTLQWGEYQEL